MVDKMNNFSKKWLLRNNNLCTAPINSNNFTARARFKSGALCISITGCWDRCLNPSWTWWSYTGRNQTKWHLKSWLTTCTLAVQCLKSNYKLNWNRGWAS
jgi:hypothetical protein